MVANTQSEGVSVPWRVGLYVGSHQELARRFPIRVLTSSIAPQHQGAVKAVKNPFRFRKEHLPHLAVPHRNESLTREVGLAEAFSPYPR
jgi:hypothetical protein